MTTNAIDQTAVKRLERSRSDRMVAGVCEGLARYFDLNPAFYRVGFVVLTLLGGAGILIYLAAVLVIPEEGKHDSIAAEALRGRRERPWPLIGVGLDRRRRRGAPLAGDPLAAGRRRLGSRAPRRGRDPLDAALLADRRRREIVLAADGTPVERPSRGGHVIAVISVILAVMVVAVLAAAATVATVFHVDVRNGVGERTYQPALAAGVQPRVQAGHRRRSDSISPEPGSRSARRGSMRAWASAS